MSDEIVVPEQSQTPEQMRSKVLAIEQAMVNMPEHQIVIEPVHYVAHGLYAREITIPKGACLTGKIHLFEHINIISKGKIMVMTDEGIKTITAPATIISKPGIKRVGYALEETVWTTVHACEVKDVEEAEKLLVVDTFEEFERRTLGEASCHLLP